MNANQAGSCITLFNVSFANVWALVQVLPWILDVGYTILAVALLVAFMGHILFGEFEATMTSLPSSIAGMFLGFGIVI